MIIYKLKLPEYGPFEGQLPTGFRVISAHAQDDNPCVWVECDSTAPKTRARFFVAVTGSEFRQANMKFIGTVLLSEGRYVCHVYQDLYLPPVSSSPSDITSSD